MVIPRTRICRQDTSLSGIRSQSWIRISNGLDKFVRDLTEKTRMPCENDDSSASKGQESRIKEYSRTRADKFVAKAQPKPTSSPSSSSSVTSVPISERIWIDIESWEHTQKDTQSFPVSNGMTALLRHGSLPRDQDGAIKIWRSKMEFRSAIPSSVYWSIRLWIDHLQKGGGHKKKFQCCTDSTRESVKHCLRVNQGHSEKNPMDPSWQDSVLVPNNFFEFIYLVECYFNIRSIIASGLIAGRKNSERDRQTLLFRVVNPLDRYYYEQKELDLTKSRLAAYKYKWKIHQDAVYWVDIRRAHRMGLTFFQTRSNAIIPYDSLPSSCIEKVVSMKTKEVFYTKTSKSPRPAPMITLKVNWQKDWNSDAEVSGSSSQPLQPNQLARTEQPVLLKSRTTLDQQTCSRMSRRTMKNWIKQERDNK